MAQVRPQGGFNSIVFVSFALMFVFIGTAADKAPPFPSLDNIQAFTIQYRVAIKDKNYTMWAKESYDSMQKKVRMDYMKNGMTSSLLLDYHENSYTSYSYNSTTKTAYDCSVRKLDASTGNKLDPFNFKDVSSGSKIPHSVSTIEILQFAKASNPEYKRAELDGLTVDKWTVNKDLDGRRTLTLQFYFTAANFSVFGEITNSQVPLRAKVTIKENQKTIEHDYSYLEFKGFDALPEDVFSLPEFTVCKDAIQWESRSLTGVDDFTYTLETVQHTRAQDDDHWVSVELKTVSRDASRRLVREDASQRISISDFSTGVEYLIDGRSCNTRPIDPHYVPSAKETENGVITMGDNDEIKFIRGKFSLTGKKTIRSIPAMALARESKEEGYFVEGYFEEMDADPLSLIVYYPDPDLKTYYHFYNIEKSATHYGGDPFDISRCRSSDEIAVFDLTLDIRNVSESSIQRYIDKIIGDLKNEVAKVAEVSSLQVSHNSYYLNMEQAELHWYGAFLGPDLDSKRANVKNSLQMKATDDIFSAVSEAIKAKTFKIQYSDTQSFNALKIQSEIEEFYLAVREDDALFRFNKRENLCVDILENNFINSATNSERSCAQACLDNQWVNCNAFQYIKETKSCYFGRQKKSPKLLETPGCDYYSVSYLQSFNSFPGTVLVKEESNGKSVTVESAELCAERCIDEESFECESIYFCESASRCVLYDVRDLNKDTNPMNGSDQHSTCNHYTRKSRDDFEITTSTSLRFPDQVTMTTNSVSECADQCTSNKDGCKMFSACNWGRHFLCTIVPKSLSTSVTYMYYSSCNVYTQVSTGTSHQPGSNTCTKCGNADESSDVGTTGYTLGGMVGLGIAMAMTGIAVGAISAFLLYHSQSGEHA